MSYTLADLKAELQGILWPFGEAENLITAHAAMFVEALIDIQQWAECYQINNTFIVPQCNTLFKCGLTVTDAPRGRIKRVYTIDQINQTTGQEDPSVPVDWCSMVEYLQVDYSQLDEYVSNTLASAWGGGFWGWFGGLFNGVPITSLVALPACWIDKYTFPPPTDAGLSTAPPLPLGYHYPQNSTDVPNGRAQSGCWAQKGGQIFLAPWIQSTETVIIEWDGLKRTWNDLDIVDNDPILKSAVENYVRWQHAQKYDHDYEEAKVFQDSYNDLRSRLIYECAKENEIREGNQSSKARGASTVVPTFTNTAQQATASCPAGQTGAAVTVIVPAGNVISLISVADANAKAQSLALQQAGGQLQCTTPVPTFTNAQQTYTANCSTGTGSPVTVTIDAGTVTSTVSQADANAQALLLATNQATAQLSCTYVNTAQTFTGTCANGSNSTSRTVAAGQFTSMLSQADANSKALASATNQVNAILAPLCSVQLFINTQQSVPVSRTCLRGNIGIVTLQVTITVPAGTVTSTVSQAAANAAAQAIGLAEGQAQLQAECNQQIIL